MKIYPNKPIKITKENQNQLKMPFASLVCIFFYIYISCHINQNSIPGHGLNLLVVVLKFPLSVTVLASHKINITIAGVGDFNSSILYFSPAGKFPKNFVYSRGKFLFTFSEEWVREGFKGTGKLYFYVVTKVNMSSLPTGCYAVHYTGVDRLFTMTKVAHWDFKGT